jgi:hypothetical protein
MALKSHGDLRRAMAELQRAEELYAKNPSEQERIRRMKAAIRAASPDSLEPLFAADSVAVSHRATRFRIGVPSSR